MPQRLLALLLCAALFIPSCALAEDTTPEPERFVAPTLPPDAIAWDSSHPDILDEDMLYARSAILIEANTGEVLFEKNADEIMYPASTTKIMTAYIALQMGDMDNDVVTVSQNAIDLVPPTYQTIPLSAGEQVPLLDLISVMLIRSGNEAANAIAEFLSGSVESFADLMNQTAQMLGCSSSTHFANPSGVHDENHYTTARDLMTITKHALTLPYFSEITSTTIYKVPATNKSEERTLRNTNNLMNKAYADYYSPYAVGIKTGSTDNAGRCVISKGTGNGYNYLCVIMNAPMQNIDDDEPLENCAFVDCRRMFNWVFNHIELKSIASPTQIITEVPLKLSFRTDHISLVPGEEVLALVPTGADAGSVLIEPVPETVPKSVDAPVKKGQEICEARVLYAGEEIARIKLVASEDVSRNVLLFIGATIKKVASSTVFKIIASIVAVLVVGYIALFIYENYKRRQRRKLKLVNPGVKGNGYTEKKGRKKK